MIIAIVVLAATENSQGNHGQHWHDFRGDNRQLVQSDPQCGIAPKFIFHSPPKGQATNRVYNGFRAYKGMFPANVNLEISYSDNTIMICGGTLISPDTVLTAAHCVNHMNGVMAKKVDATFGTIGVGVHGRKPKSVKGRRFCISSNFNQRNFENDFAIIKLSMSVKLNDYYQTACLPSRRLAATDLCYSVGNGYTQTGGSFSSSLLYFQVRIMKSCDKTIRSRTQACFEQVGRVRGWESAVCKGDSGSGVFCYVDGKWQVYGIVNNGPKHCGPPNSNKGYFDVQSHLSSIKNVIASCV